MKAYFQAAVVAASFTFALAAPSPAVEPCAQISAALVSNNTPTISGSPVLDPDIAFACLNSVPLDKAGDLKQLEGLKTMINFQSTLAYLKNPPPGWLYPGVDVLGTIDSMITKLQSGGYANEYTFQLEVFDLITSIHDFHAVYDADILSVFNFGRDSPGLLSLSTDGTSLPNIYGFEDIFALSTKNASGYTPSPVASINNTDVQTWLNQYATFNPWDHDPDANYQSVIFSSPILAFQLGGANSFTTGFYHFPGRETLLKFSNGTTKAVYSFANTQEDFTGVTDGASFFQKFCNPPLASATASATASGSIIATSSAASVTLSGSASATAIAASSVFTNNLYTPLPSASSKPFSNVYPAPFIIAPKLSIAAFFPETQSDLLVISIPTFDPADGNYEFQDVFRSALATAKAQGKTRLILDIRGNGGGNVVDGFSLFNQLFPSQSAYGGSNMAAWPLFDAMGQVASSGINQSALYQLQPLSAFDVQEDLTISDSHYASWSDFYGPVAAHGGSFTNIRRYNFSDVKYNSLGQPLYLYGNDTAPQPQTFDAENIVMLSDGFCGSTCAIFAELLKTQAGVQSVAVGGRKQNCPMVNVGGSKGSNDQDIATLALAAQSLYGIADAEQSKLFQPYVDAGLEQNAAQLINRAPQNRNLNFQNNIRKGDSSATPLMFVYEAANYRFFNTPEMILDQTAVWSYAYNLRWGNATSIPGSTGDPSAQTGYGTSYFNSAPKCATNFFGANNTWGYPGAYSGSSAPSASASASASLSGPTSTSTAPTPSPPAATGGASAVNSGVGLLGLVLLSCGWVL